MTCLTYAAALEEAAVSHGSGKRQSLGGSRNTMLSLNEDPAAEMFISLPPDIQAFVAQFLGGRVSFDFMADSLFRMMTAERTFGVDSVRGQ